MNQIFTEIVNEIKKSSLNELAGFIFYFSYSISLNIFGIKYLLTLISLLIFTLFCKKLCGKNIRYNENKNLYSLFILFILIGLVLCIFNLHSFKWLTTMLYKLFYIRITNIKSIVYYSNILFKVLISYKSVCIILYDAFNSNEDNYLTHALTEQYFSFSVLFIALYFFSML